jgi:ubiquinone/menaquinone biosynthesis C-methylase UbiE
MKTVLDVCCGARMFYSDKHDPRVTFCDIRKSETILCDGRVLRIKPDMITDFRCLPFDDASYQVVIFDPPHIMHAGKNSWLAQKYGLLDKDTWRDDLRKGFTECFRVLKPGGVLVFKWSEVDIMRVEILKLTDQVPIISHRYGKKNNTHWMLFLKEDN